MQKALKKEFGHNTNISSISIVLFFVLIYFWYSQVTHGAFDYSAIGFIQGTIKSLNELFIVDSRGGALPEVLGVGFGEITILRKIHIITQWIVIILLGIGLVNLILKQILNSKFKMCNYTLESKELDFDYFLLSISCFGILVFCVTNPQASTGLGTDRVYYQMTVVLSLLFVIGCTVVSKIAKINHIFLILLVLIPYFMFGTGVLYQICDDPREPTFTSNGTLYYSYYTQEANIKSAEWLNKLRDDNIKINTLSISWINTLGDISNLSKKYNISQEMDSGGYYSFDKRGAFINKNSKNISLFSKSLYTTDQLYDNGESKIYLF
jgi:uncharacterized membrane protein